MFVRKIAVIDLGTNTFHLLIAEVEGKEMKVLYSEKKAVRIGKGGINQGFIADDAIDRALSTLLAFKEKTLEFGVTEIHAIATSAFRNARNGVVLADKIFNTTGINVNIISGDREAELIYFGVNEALDLALDKSLIVDIGGGSVEFIIANKEMIFWKQSFEIGGQRMLELFQKTDPIAQDDITNLNYYLEEKLMPLKEALMLFPTQILVGSSGSFDTFSDIDLKNKGFDFSIEAKKEYALSLSDFDSIYIELITKERSRRLEMPGMIELRVDMIVVASVLVRFLIKNFSIQQLRISSYALKEGVLSKIIKGEDLVE